MRHFTLTIASQYFARQTPPCLVISSLLIQPKENLMISSFCCRIFYVIPVWSRVLGMLLISLFSFAVVPASAQRPSNVYRPPADNFNQGQQPDRTAQGRPIFRQNQGGQQVIQNFQQGQTFQTVPQYQTVPGTPQYTYPPQYIYPQQTPVYQQPVVEVPGQVIPAQNDAENAELKRSLVKARDLMEKYQIKLEEISRRNQELESQITTLQQSGDMSDTASQELAAAKAAAAQAQEQMSGLNNQLDRQKQVGAELQQRIVELQKSAQMAAGSDEQLAELTKISRQLKTRNDELSGNVKTLQNALRDKETQIASMGSNEDSKLADLRELLEESETTNKDLSLKLKAAQESAAEMAAPQEDPALDQLRADNRQLGQEKLQLESEKSQLNDMLGKLQSQNSELDAEVTRLSNMPAPAPAPVVEASSFAATPSADLTGLRNQLASVNRRNGQLERQLKFSKSKYASLTEENAQLIKDADSESSIDVAAAPVAVAPIKSAPVAVAVPELGLSTVSAGWPVKYWIFGMLGVGLAVGLCVAWYESIVDPKGLRRATTTATNIASNHARPNHGPSNQ